MEVDHHGQLVNFGGACWPGYAQVETVFTDLRRLGKQGRNPGLGLGAWWARRGGGDLCSSRGRVWLRRRKASLARRIMGEPDVLEMLDAARCRAFVSDLAKRCRRVRVRERPGKDKT